MNKIFLLLFYISFIISCRAQENKQTISQRIEHLNIDSLIAIHIEKSKIPAMVVGVFDQKSVEIYYKGIRNTTDSIAIQENDKFHIGSCTKAITSFVAARLIEKGLINWNSTVSDIFSERKPFIQEYYKNKTLADLLSHRAGIKPFTSGNEFKSVPDSVANAPEELKRKLFTNWLLQQEPTLSNEKKYIYSNAGYSVAACMLKEVSGKSWEQLVKEEFFTVFNIDGFFGHPKFSNVNQPWGHIIPLQWGIPSMLLSPLPDSLNYSLDFIEPAGDISLSAKDYAVFLHEILKGLQGNSTKLTNETFNTLFYSYENYSMGWGNPTERNMHFLSHDGSDGTFYCRVLICREKDFGVLLFANTAHGNTAKSLHEISGIIEKGIKQ